MGTFFLGWRRKAGCVTLVLACMLVGAWGYSQSNPCTFSAPVDSMTAYGLEFDPTRITIARTRIYLPAAGQQVTLDDDGIIVIEDKPRQAKFRENDDHTIRKIDKQRFPNGRISTSNYSICVCDIMKFLDTSYWSITFPLALLSAWLLLSKPRKPIAKLPEKEFIGQSSV